MSDITETAVPARRSKARELERLFAERVAPLQRLAYLLTGDHHLAEDITQQAFIRFYGKFMNLRDPAAADAYLRRTVVNLARGHHRRVKRERQYLDQNQPRDIVVAESPVAERDVLVRAIRQLPYRQRAAIVLRYFGDLSEREAAEALDCSTNAIKALTARSMTRLRELTKGVIDD
jgi:RNA polymerase sigma-70 factor (sigma-E family)